MLFFHHAGKMSSIPPPAGGLSAAIVIVARRWKECHVVAAVEGHELKAPETEHRPGSERLLETAHLELDGRLFVNTQQAPTWRANCRRFETRGSLSRRVNVAACPSSDGSTRGRARRGEVRRPETGVREVGIPRPSCSSRAQVGCACSRGLQASTRERERAASRERLSRPRPCTANPL
jgi:sirohydrochlorin ferrochelatase